MANFAGSKEDFANQMIATERKLLSLLDDMSALVSAYSSSVHGFNPGGANQFVDEDFSNINKHLTAAIVDDVLFAFANISSGVSQGQREALRKGIPGGLP